MFSTPLHRFRSIALAEGVSFLILLFIAMPLKYMSGMPEPVKFFGWIHGVLFVAYLITLLQVWIDKKWSFKQVVIAFFASLLPFGTFVMDRQWKKQA